MSSVETGQLNFHQASVGDEASNGIFKLTKKSVMTAPFVTISRLYIACHVAEVTKCP